MILFAVSFAANALITFSVANAIRRDTADIVPAFGPDSPARRILACIYVAIGAVSLYALLHMVIGNADVARTIGLTLFPLQILYKVLTAFTVGLENVVVRANLGIVALLGLTLALG